jgi:DNA repair exonuclease SbcCD ATPase subunit
MEKTIYSNGIMAENDIQAQLNRIEKFLQGEFTERKIDLQKQNAEIDLLKFSLKEKEIEINAVKERLRQGLELAEGNRQLINKLLGEISKLQNDIDWYKRTYETRSFLGMVRQKLKMAKKKP